MSGGNSRSSGHSLFRDLVTNVTMETPVVCSAGSIVTTSNCAISVVQHDKNFLHVGLSLHRSSHKSSWASVMFYSIGSWTSKYR